MRPGRAFIGSIIIPMILLSSSTSALAQSPYNVKGRWTQPTDQGATWGHAPIHMALLRGDANYPAPGTYHSYILSWFDDDQEVSGWNGGVWGWNPPPASYDGGTYPDTITIAAIVRLPSQPPPPGLAPGVDIFCSGHATLPDGRLLVAGGHEKLANEADVNGIKDVRVYDAQTQLWSADDTMSLRRYYPTNTALADGRMLVTAGWQYFHMLTFGGRTLPGDAASARDDIQRRAILKTSRWDETITKPIGENNWPEKRWNHTMVFKPAANGLQQDGRIIVFGGEGGGQPALDDVWLLKRSQDYDNATERYQWERQTSAPVPLTRHSAILESFRAEACTYLEERMPRARSKVCCARCICYPELGICGGRHKPAVLPPARALVTLPCTTTSIPMPPRLPPVLSRAETG